MKTHCFFLLAIVIGGLPLARAEDAPAPNAAVKLETPTLFPAPNLPGLIPSGSPQATPPPMPEAAATAPVAVTPAAALKKGTAEQLRQAIRIRELKTVVEEDPEVIAQKATAQCAKTEAGRCVAMRNYYTLLYTKIEKLDPSLQPLLETQLHVILTRYEQHRVRPTVLIEPIAALPGSCSADHKVDEALVDETFSKKKAKKY